MKRVLRWLAGDDSEEREAAPAEPSGGSVPMERVEEYVRYFPIGTRIRYSPEFQASTKIDSLVLGYRINGQMVFEAHALRFSMASGRLSLGLRVGTGWDEIRGVDDFCFILPHQFRQEVDFAVSFGDGDSMKEKKVNDFRRNSMVRLMNKGSDGKVPSVDTTVLMTLGITSGLYSNLRVAILQPDQSTFNLLDQRIFHRVYTKIPTTVTLDVKGPRYNCSLVDFSERYLRLDMVECRDFARTLRDGVKVILAIESGSAENPITLGCQVFKKRGDHCIISLSTIFKDKRFQRVDPIDELEIKTRLLHHPKTQEGLARD